MLFPARLAVNPGSEKEDEQKNSLLRFLRCGFQRIRSGRGRLKRMKSWFFTFSFISLVCRSSCSTTLSLCSSPHPQVVCKLCKVHRTRFMKPCRALIFNYIQEGAEGKGERRRRRRRRSRRVSVLVHAVSGWIAPIRVCGNWSCSCSLTLRRHEVQKLLGNCKLVLIGNLQVLRKGTHGKF